MKKTLLILLILLSFQTAQSQSGIYFYEFAEKLSSYYDKEMIDDVKNTLPQGSDFSIWGWDVGDYSGDKINDLAMAIYIKGDKKKRVKVYHFVDIDGYLSKVNEEFFDFVELPLEIGIVIKKNVCYVTQKNKQFHWKILGYQFDNGVFSLLDEYQTRRDGKFTLENYINYKTERGSEKILLTKDGSTQAENNYLALPSYNRGRKVYRGNSYDIYSNTIDYVLKGSYWWKGETDLSFNVKSGYDSEFLYFTVNVHDDAVVPSLCDTCTGDAVEIWLDLNKFYNKDLEYVSVESDKIKKAKLPETGIFKFNLALGDFKEVKPSVKLTTIENLDNAQKSAIQRIKVSTNFISDGYSMKVKLPLEILGLSTQAITDSSNTALGFTAVISDWDNEFRPEEFTQLATSAFNPLDPFTFGKLVIIPNGSNYGMSFNTLKNDIVKFINEYGF